MTYPNRGTEGVEPSPGGFTVLCDCGTATQVILGGMGEHEHVAHQEIAVTCAGCESAHWLTIIPVTPLPDEPVVTA